MAGEAGGVAKAIAIMKNRAALLLGGSRPEGRRKCSMLPKSLDPDVSNYNSLAHAQQPVSTHRPKLFFGQLSSYQTRSRACPRGKIEYLYLDFGTATSTTTNLLNSTPLAVSLRSRVVDQVARAGVNYKFDFDYAILVNLPR
jgi:hypothetical protein